MLEDITVGQILAAAAVVTAVAVLLRRAHAMMRRVTDLLDDWFGERPRPGVPERKGVMERLSDQDAALKDVQARIVLAAGVSDGQLVRVERLLLRHIRESRVWVAAVDRAAAERDFHMPAWPDLPDDADADQPPHQP